jgi:hypothetical protein
MESVFTALKDTPLPTILVIAGLVFLLLSMAGQLIGHITVPPERQRWAAVTGGMLLIMGIGLHVIPLMWPSASGTRNAPVSQLSTPPVEEVSPRPSPASPRVSLPPKPDSGPAPVQTITPGVVATITRFQKSGDLVTMEITLRNASTRDANACMHAYYTELIDQATGDNWRATLHAGRECMALDAQKTGRVWMRFEVREPEGRTFALSSPFLKETVENLVLREPS